MATMRLALPWEARISGEERQRGTRVESSENPSGSFAPSSSEVPAEDAALAAACQAGDLHAYERLYSLHGRRMKNIARNLLGNPIDAEDAVQETFLKVMTSLPYTSRIVKGVIVLIDDENDENEKRCREIMMI